MATLFGGDTPDSLVGTNDYDVIDGHGGDDTLRGLGGGDALFGGPGDVIDGGAGLDHLVYDASAQTAALVLDAHDPAAVATVTLGGVARGSITSVEFVDVYGGSGDDSIVGASGDASNPFVSIFSGDNLYGGAGNDTLRGAANDTLDGGAGDDVLSGGTASYLSAGAAVTIDLRLSGAQETGGAGHDLLTSITNVGDSLFTDTLTGDDFSNTFYVRGGSDQVFGLGGDDYVRVDPHPSSGALVGVLGAPAVYGGDGSDTLTASQAQSANVTLDGGAGDDWLSAVAIDAVSLYGGGGNDHVSVDPSFGHWQASLGSGQDTLSFSGYVSPLPFTGPGGSVADFQTGDLGDVVALGDLADVSARPFSDGHLRLLQSGADVLLQIDRDGGGDGYATAVIFQNTQKGAFTAHNFSGVDPRLALYGGAGPDTLTGSADGDLLDGKGGADRLVGGGGDDTYAVDNAGDVVVEAAGGGTDTVRTTLSLYRLIPNVEILHHDGTSAFNGYGEAGANALYSDAAVAATLHGGAGDDTLYGGAGYDSLYGDGGDDLQYGGGGNDYFRTLTGEGADTLYGGDGIDVLTFERTDATASLRIDLTLTGLQAIGDGSFVQGFEIVRFAGGLGNDYERGSSVADVLKGGGGADTLIGGGAADTLQGGAGHDTVTGGSGADVFRLDGPVPGADDIFTDYVAGLDKVALSAAGFGVASVTDFDIVTASVGPASLRPTLIVDAAAHTLSWDADGAGMGAAVLLAHGVFTTAPGDYLLF